MRNARHTDPDTSMEAARSVIHQAAHHKKIVLAAIKDAGPLTSEEIAALTRLTHAQVWRRTSDLKNERKIIDTGERRKNHSGRYAVVWGLPTDVIISEQGMLI